MIARCVDCGGPIVRGDDITRSLAKGGFAHRDCDEQKRAERARRLIDKIMRRAPPSTDGDTP